MPLDPAGAQADAAGLTWAQVGRKVSLCATERSSAPRTRTAETGAGRECFASAERPRGGLASGWRPERPRPAPLPGTSH